MHSNTPSRSIDRDPSPVDTKLHATAQRAIARDLPQSTDNAPDEHPTHNLFLVSPLPPKFILAALLGLWSPNAWHPPAKQGSRLTPDESDEQALNSNAPAIITTLTRFEIIFSVPCGFGGFP